MYVYMSIFIYLGIYMHICQLKKCCDEGIEKAQYLHSI